MDDSGKRESEGEEENAPKTEAKDNPWYLLAKLYGVPDYTTQTAIGFVEPKQVDAELIKMNRRAWNRFLVPYLGEAREELIDRKRYTAEDLEFLSQDQTKEFQDAIAKRGGSIESLVSAVSDRYIDFSKVEFKLFVCFKGYIFTTAHHGANRRFHDHP